MLKLVYHTSVFGPIDFEYDRPLIRVGRNEDNDLVLRHPSVKPHHCLLLFRDEKVLCLPPDKSISPQTDLRSLDGPEFGKGDQLWIGELHFTFAHSTQTLAIPEVRSHDAEPEKADAAASGSGHSAAGRYTLFCPQCRKSYSDSEVKRVGLVGNPKHCLCPKCSRVLAVEPEPPKAASAPRK